jgi:capsular polysaccharide transport system permease protein
MHPPEHTHFAPARFQMARNVIALMLREMTTRYGRTPGGYVWVLLQPAGAIAMLTLVLAVGLRVRTPGLGTSFPIFYATGILPFQMFNILGNTVAGAIPFSRALLRYPRVNFIDAIIARILLNSLTQLLVSLIVLGSLLTMSHANTRVDPVPILQGLGLVVLLGAGFGALTGYLFQIFPVLGSVWNIISTPLMLISGVIFLYDTMPRWAREMLWYNPLVHVIGLVRRGVYPMYDAAYVSPAYVAGLGLVMLAAGLLLLKRYHKDIISR